MEDLELESDETADEGVKEEEKDELDKERRNGMK